MNGRRHLGSIIHNSWKCFGIASLGLLTAKAELFVSSFNNHQVLRYHETTGAFLDVFVPNLDGRLYSPHGLAFGPDGNLYVANAGWDSVLRYDGVTGAFIDNFIPAGRGGLMYPVTLIFHDDGLLYISSQLNHRVLRYSSSTGAFQDVFAAPNAELVGPSDMVFGPDGLLYVVGRFSERVVRYDGHTGALVDSFGFGLLSQPFGLRFGAHADLLVVSGNQNRIQQFNTTTGDFVQTFSSTGGLNFPVGLVQGPDANFYVASFGNHKIARFDATGASLGDFVPSGSGGLRGPNFLAFRPPPISPPHLDIAISGFDGVLTWETNALRLHLERDSGGLATQQWEHVTNVVTVNGRSNQVTLPAELSRQFFRLVSP